jgi:hypothetical protein
VPRFVAEPVLLLPVVAPVPVLELPPRLLLAPVRLPVLELLPVPVVAPVLSVPDVLPVPLMLLPEAPVVPVPVVLLPADAPVPPVPALLPLLWANATPPSASAAAAASAERLILLAFILCPSVMLSDASRAVPSPYEERAQALAAKRVRVRQTDPTSGTSGKCPLCALARSRMLLA